MVPWMLMLGLLRAVRADSRDCRLVRGLVRGVGRRFHHASQSLSQSVRVKSVYYKEKVPSVGSNRDEKRT